MCIGINNNYYHVIGVKCAAQSRLVILVLLLLGTVRVKNSVPRLLGLTPNQLVRTRQKDKIDHAQPMQSLASIACPQDKSLNKSLVEI